MQFAMMNQEHQQETEEAEGNRTSHSGQQETGGGTTPLQRE